MQHNVLILHHAVLKIISTSIKCVCYANKMHSGQNITNFSIVYIHTTTMVPLAIECVIIFWVVLAPMQFRSNLHTVSIYECFSLLVFCHFLKYHPSEIIQRQSTCKTSPLTVFFPVSTTLMLYWNQLSSIEGHILLSRGKTCVLHIVFLLLKTRWHCK